MHESSRDPLMPPLPSLALAGNARGARILARVLAACSVLVVLSIAFLP
jgi:hypothetical protein